jgi:hypothetical protein
VAVRYTFPGLFNGRNQVVVRGGDEGSVICSKKDILFFASGGLKGPVVGADI